MDRSEWALQLRVGLVEVITAPVCYYQPPGEANCALCFDVYALEDLEIDHPDGREWYGRDLNFLDRIRKEWKEYDRGVKLRALCKSCNSRDGSTRWRGRARWL